MSRLADPGIAGSTSRRDSAASPSPSPYPYPYRMRIDFVVRVAGLPTSVLDEMDTASTAARLETVACLREWLRVEGAAISDALYPVIGGLAEPELKPRLVALRRAVYQGRAPHGLLDISIVAALPAALLARIRRWAAERDRCGALVEELPDLLASDIASALPALRRVAAHPDLQRGLVLASPSLLAQLRAWQACGAHTPPRRRVLASLVRYVGRMTMKTSPRSTFTCSGLGRWASTGVPVELHGAPAYRGPGGGHRHHATEFHRGLVTVIAEHLARRDGLAEHVQVRLNPSLVADGSALRFLEPPPSSAVVAVRASGAIEAVLAHVRAAAGGRVAEMRRALELQPGGAALVPLADRLFELGVLERYVPVPDQEPDALRALAVWMSAAARAVGDADLGAAADRLAVVPSLGERYASVDGPERLQGVLNEIAAAAGGVLVDLGIAERPDNLSVRESFFENTLLTYEVANCDPQRLRSALDALNALRRLLALYDPALPFRLALAEYVRGRWGPGARLPLVSLYHELHRESGGLEPDAPGRLTAHRVVVLKPAFGARLGGDALSTSPVPRVRELAELRASVLRDFAGRPVGCDGVQHLTTEEVLGRADAWPRYVTAPRSMGFYVQFAGAAADEPILVVNAAGSGHGRGHGRVLRLAGRDSTAPANPGGGGENATGPVYAEIDHSFLTNLNTRVPQSPYCIDYPGHVPRRRPEHLIPWGELAAVHDEASGLLRLEWERGRVEVRPVHTGMLTEMWLPPPASFLIWGFGEPPTLLRPGLPLLGESGRQPSGEQVRARLRMQIGPVVARRASWSVRAAAIPARINGEDYSAWMLRLLEWLRGKGVPQRCFVRVHTPGGGGGNTRWPKARKPLYVDFTNWFLVLAFEQALAVPDRVVVFDEALPAPRDALPAPDGSAHVTEFLFDLDATERPDPRHPNIPTDRSGPATKGRT